eukprot:9986846-Alexandrium_andersonii.AAC.1
MLQPALQISDELRGPHAVRRAHRRRAGRLLRLLLFLRLLILALELRLVDRTAARSTRRPPGGLGVPA